jgi:pimeloyl-ACP methyl ester carboxylesterase
MPSQAGEALAHLRLASEIAGLDVSDVVTPTDRHLVVDGLRLHCLDWGRHDRPPLLFLHGGRLTAHTWDLVCLALCSRDVLERTRRRGAIGRPQHPGRQSMRTDPSPHRLLRRNRRLAERAERMPST